ncbi:5-aminolevulinate synthase [Plantactinospora endophytica]|uniref:5-aminolevulinic acid synthase n=1 Tax=Plantactinospora endophytica TaxID=673535 RepID=A0ABQ4DV14_9ACTN|nr:5-aminolevulinate synthase [Plantactinospora endophytica]GIG86269.1 5-aminolevulinate synthase [Plantactinospora endophytica]
MTRQLDFFADELKRLGDRRRSFLEIDRRAGQFPSATSRRGAGDADHEISVWCSNDYLGMGQHPVVLEAVKTAVDAVGAGSGGSRNIGGTSQFHVLLEQELAALHRKEAALLFVSGYAANDGALTVLTGRMPGTLVFSDELNHASIIDGLRHGGAEKRIFRHNDTGHLAELLAAAHPDRPKLIVLESVYSMSGDVAPLAEVSELAARYRAVTFLDEVHAVGLYGPEGAGIAAREGLAEDFTIVMGTLGKGFGTAGGYIAGPAVLVEAVRAFSRPFIFTTSMPPATAAGALAAVRHLRSSEYERTRLRENTQLLHRLLTERGIPFLSARSHIVSVPVGDDLLCRRASALLLQGHGIYVQAINLPSVRPGDELLRVAPSATHTTHDVRTFAEALDDVWTELGIPRSGSSATTARAEDGPTGGATRSGYGTPLPLNAHAGG